MGARCIDKVRDGGVVMDRALPIESAAELARQGVAVEILCDLRRDEESAGHGSISGDRPSCSPVLPGDAYQPEPAQSRDVIMQETERHAGGLREFLQRLLGCDELEDDLPRLRAVKRCRRTLRINS